VPKPPPLKPRKLPQQRRSQQTVAKILAAAAHILTDRGLEGFNTNAVAEQAELSIGSLYQYFPDKDTLTAMLIQQNAAIFLVELQATINKTGDSFTDRIHAIIRVAVAQQLARPKLARLLDREEQRLPLDEETQATQTAIFTIISTVLREANYDHIPELTQDLIAIARGLIDTAGSMGELDVANLEARVGRAIFGYLSQSRIQLP
jgi:AcrR family transcriptional regulator